MIKAYATVALAALWLMAPRVLPAGQGGDDNPADWLGRMSMAMSHLTYQGTFVYIRDKETETMRITHHSGENGERERLVALSGPRREVIRDADGVRWVLGESSSILSDNAFRKSFFPDLSSRLENQAVASYVLKFGPSARIAGYEARQVMVLPRDHYRYGHSFWLEQHSGLPLQWELFDSKRKTLAKFVFTELHIGAEVDLHELEPDSQLTGYRTVSSELPAGNSRKVSSMRWSPSKMPPGFTLTERRVSGSQDGRGGLFEHLVYSDGLAAVSVYIEGHANRNLRDEDIQRHGTTHAYSCSNSDVSITVVGDVPAATVELIGQSVSAATP